MYTKKKFISFLYKIDALELLNFHVKFQFHFPFFFVLFSFLLGSKHFKVMEEKKQREPIKKEDQNGNFVKIINK